MQKTTIYKLTNSQNFICLTFLRDHRSQFVFSITVHFSRMCFPQHLFISNLQQFYNEIPGMRNFFRKILRQRNSLSRRLRPPYVQVRRAQSRIRHSNPIGVRRIRIANEAWRKQIKIPVSPWFPNSRRSKFNVQWIILLSILFEKNYKSKHWFG